MTIDVKDGSNYFRGLLLLIGKDHQITQGEHALMMRIGRLLGFEAEFCDTSIRDILDNPHINDEPPRFSTGELAEKFLRDGLVLAGADAEIHAAEVEWLRAVADANGLDAGPLLDSKVGGGNAAQTGKVRLEVEDLRMK